MAGTTTWVTSHRKCRICGKEDYCKYGTFPNGDTVEYCHRESGSAGETKVGVDGTLYRWMRETPWGFQVWEPVEQYERNLAAYLASIGKDYKKSSYKPVERTQQKPMPKKEPETPVAEPAHLDKVYRYFLSLLKLEEFHKNALLLEWGAVKGLYEQILSVFPIVSLPPKDADRHQEYYMVTNATRAELMSKLTQQFDSLEGVPGFYLNDENRWDIITGGGILFPVFNSKGQIVALRLGDDHPKAKMQRNGQDITLYFNYGCWGYWQTNDKFCSLWGKGKHMIELTQRGYPKGAKIMGKYKNFASSMTIEENGIIKAKYKKSCSSGSQISLYAKEGDDWSVVYITEGEKKAIVANMLLGHPVICIPGVASFGKLFQDELGMHKSMVNVLIEKGTRLFVIAYDADKKVNQDVLMSELKAVKSFVERGIYIALGEWNPAWGKGIDDILLANVRPSLTMVTV